MRIPISNLDSLFLNYQIHLFTILLFILILAHTSYSQQALHDENNRHLSKNRQSSAMTNHFGRYIEQTAATQNDSNVTLIGRWGDQPCYAVFVNGNYAYIGKDLAMGILDISNPVSPMLVGEVKTSYRIRDIYVSGKYAYVVNGKDGLRIIDVSRPSSPTEVGFFDTGNYACGIHVFGKYAYVADGNAGLRIIDISNPTAPNEIGFYNIEGYDDALDVYSSGNYAYVADGPAGLQIIDVSAPTQPTKVGFFDTGPYAVDVCVSGNYAYVADSDEEWEVDMNGLRIIDISNPTSPTEVGGFIDKAFDAWGIYVSDNYAYVADAPYGLRIIDISIPASPTEAGRFKTKDVPRDVYVSGTYIFVAAERDGLCILQNDLLSKIERNSQNPSGFMLQQNFPNPFNSSTTIRYFIQEIGLVQLKIYDISGGLVTIAVNEEQLAGEYYIVWQGLSQENMAVSSGIYFCHLNLLTKNGSSSQMRKLLLVR